MPHLLLSGRLNNFARRLIAAIFKSRIQARIWHVQAFLDQGRLARRDSHPLADLAHRDGLQTREDFHEEALPLFLDDFLHLILGKLRLQLRDLEAASPGCLPLSGNSGYFPLDIRTNVLYNAGNLPRPHPSSLSTLTLCHAPPSLNSSAPRVSFACQIPALSAAIAPYTCGAFLPHASSHFLLPTFQPLPTPARPAA